VEGEIDASELDRLDAEAKAEVDDAVKEAREAPVPTPDQLTADVYLNY
jgi:pyruvate dehydrogenase E1 component alpha subunit